METVLHEASADLSGPGVFSRPNRRAKQRENLACKLDALSHTADSIDLVYKDTLRSLLNTFDNLTYIDTENRQVEVTCRHGNPERVIAKMREEDNIILPFISVVQTNSDNDPRRAKYHPVLMHEKYWDDKTQRAIRVISLAPVPVNISYDINVWSKYSYSMDQLIQKIRLKFNPSLIIKTDCTQGS